MNKESLEIKIKIKIRLLIYKREKVLLNHIDQELDKIVVEGIMKGKSLLLIHNLIIEVVIRLQTTKTQINNNSNSLILLIEL